MNKFLKITGLVVGLIIILLAGAVVYINSTYPDVAEAPNIKVEMTPENIARGEYLANNVSVCMDCHTPRDHSKFANPAITGKLGHGGDVFTEEMGFPGTYYAKNLTPTALKDWTDGEIYRAITAGVDKDGRELFPFMPYNIYGKMDPDDVKAIIAYLRSLPEGGEVTPKSETNFPVSLFIKMAPADQKPMTRPSPEDTIAYGEYLSIISGCQFCHTPIDDQNQIIPGKEFSGGHEFGVPGGIVRSANITPDEESGIGIWEEEDFINRFKYYLDESAKQMAVKPGQFQTHMPWFFYADMKEEDLSAIYKYLKTVKPIRSNVETFTVIQ